MAATPAGVAEAAIAAAGPDAPPRARALAWDRLAWAHAKAQDALTAGTSRLKGYRDVPAVREVLQSAR